MLSAFLAFSVIKVVSIQSRDNHLFKAGKNNPRGSSLGEDRSKREGSPTVLEGVEILDRATKTRMIDGFIGLMLSRNLSDGQPRRRTSFGRSHALISLIGVKNQDPAPVELKDDGNCTNICSESTCIQKEDGSIADGFAFVDKT